MSDSRKGNGGRDHSFSSKSRPPPRDHSRQRNGYGPGHAEVRASKRIFAATGSSFQAAEPLYGGRQASGRSSNRAPLQPMPPPPRGQTPPPRPPTPEPFLPMVNPSPPREPSRGQTPPPRPPTPEPFLPMVNPSRPGSAASTTSTTSSVSDISLSDISVGVPSLPPIARPSTPSSPSPSPPTPQPPTPPRVPTPPINHNVLAEAEPSEDHRRSYSPIPTTREQAQKAIDLKGRGALMRKLRPGSPETQRRAAMLEAVEQADRRMIGGMGEHDDSAARAETVAKVGGAVGGVTTAVLGFTPGAPAAPFVAGATAALTTGARSKAAYEAHASRQAIDRVRQYEVGDSHLKQRSATRDTQMRENIGKAVGGVVTTAADILAPGAASNAASAVNRAVGRRLGTDTESARVDEALAVLGTSGHARPRTPPADGEFHSIAPTPPSTPPANHNTSPRSRR